MHYIFFPAEYFFSNLANDTIQVILWKLKMVSFSESAKIHSWRQNLKVFTWPVECSFDKPAENFSIGIQIFFLLKVQKFIAPNQKSKKKSFSYFFYL